MKVLNKSPKLSDYLVPVNSQVGEQLILNKIPSEMEVAPRYNCLHC